MGQVADKIKNKGRRTRIDNQLDPKLLERRMNSGSNHFRQLVSISGQLDDEDYAAIRETILPVAEMVVSTFSNAKKNHTTKPEKETIKA